MSAPEVQPAPSDSPALARHKFQMAKLEADSWARIIAREVAEARTSGDWSLLPTLKTLEEFRAAERAEGVARAAWDRADAQVAS